MRRPTRRSGWAFVCILLFAWHLDNQLDRRAFLGQQLLIRVHLQVRLVFLRQLILQHRLVRDRDEGDERTRLVGGVDLLIFLGQLVHGRAREVPFQLRRIFAVLVIDQRFLDGNALRRVVGSGEFQVDIYLGPFRL